MKKTTKITLLLLAMLYTCWVLQASQIGVDRVPPMLRTYLTTQYPRAEAIKWYSNESSKELTYSVEFEQLGCFQTLQMASDGTLLRSEQDIAIADLPNFVVDYIVSSYKNPELLNATKITQQGAVSYKVHYTLHYGKQSHHWITIDNQGNVLEKKRFK